jgi:hypothetical protein
MRKRRLYSLTVVVLITALVLLTGRLEQSPPLPADSFATPAKHVNPLRPPAARAQWA